jgi:sugar O-acyltransferase (sialic acid O-acetyltransferase NeuD family)
MPISRCWVVGASGHGKVVLDALLLGSTTHQVALLDDDQRFAGQSIMGVSVAVPIRANISASDNFHVAIGNNATRQSLFRSAEMNGAQPLTIVHPRAVVSAYANVGEGVFIAASAIVACAVWVGDGVIINHAAVVDHDCRIGSFTHVAPGATIGGGVSIGERVLVGAGAVVLPGVLIGHDCRIGAGAVVTRNVASGVTVVGCPARVSDGGSSDKR